MKLVRLALLGLCCVVALTTTAGAELVGSSPGLVAVGDSLPPSSLPYVHRIATIPIRPNDSEPTALVLEGSFPWVCGDVFDVQVNSPHHISLSMRETDACLPLPQWRQVFPLGFLPAGEHRVEVELKVFDGSVVTGEPKIHVARVTFDVTHVDVPPPTTLPYVRAVHIVPHRLEPPLCAGDSILVRIGGAFPVACYELLGVEVIPSELTVIGPPTIRLIVGKPPCPIDPCPTVITPFGASVVLPPLPSNGYRLPVQVEEVICTTRGDEVVVHSELFPFRVQDCTPPQDCLLGSFVPNGAPGRCITSVSPQRPATLTYAISTPVPLAGLEGSFSLHPRGLKITTIEPTGPARGMNLSWSNNPDGGASFVLFAEHGAPIEPDLTHPSMAIPVLRLTVEASASTPIPPRTQIIANSFGSDADGNGIYHCPTLAPISATICIANECDHNRDGRIDVRDLVLMVRCLYEDGPCPDLAVLDCTQNGEFDLDDVICCAFRILHRDNCRGCPADTSRARPEPGIRYTVGEPVRSASGAGVPITLEGVGRLGGARLGIGFPVDRYEIESVELMDNPVNWLDLHQIEGGELLVGLIRTGPDASQEISPATLELMVHLRLRAGQQPGGEILTLASEFSGPDGTPLDIEMVQTLRPLAPPSGLSLSRNRPDPFTTETVFGVTLSTAARVRVDVYDIGGRLVRPLHRGHLEAGTHEMRWNGTSGDGARVRRGVYFYRAVTDDQAVARKMILLEGK